MSRGLYDPLGAGVPAAPRRRPSPALVAGGIVAVALVIFAAAVALRSSGERGEPHAVVTIDRSPPVAAAPVAAPPAAPAAPSAPVQAAAPATLVTATPGLPATAREADVDIENGVRIVRMRPPGSSRPAGQVVTVPPDAAALPRVSSGSPPPGTP